MPARAAGACQKARGVTSLENGDDAVSGGSTGLYSNNQEVFDYAPEAVFQFNDAFGVTASYERLVRGQNVLSAPACSVGLFWRM